MAPKRTPLPQLKLKYLVTSTQAAKILGIQHQTFTDYARLDRAPQPLVTVGRTRLWIKANIEGDMDPQRTQLALTELERVTRKYCEGERAAAIAEVSYVTWRSYVSRGDAGVPKPVVAIGVSPLWLVHEVVDWQYARTRKNQR